MAEILLFCYTVLLWKKTLKQQIFNKAQTYVNGTWTKKNFQPFVEWKGSVNTLFAATASTYMYVQSA